MQELPIKDQLMDRVYSFYDTYYHYGLICRHIFALSIANQDKDLARITINNTWNHPFLIILNFSLKSINKTLIPGNSSFIIKQNCSNRCSSNQPMNLEENKSNQQSN